MTGDRSRTLYGRALDVFPGGVNSPVRALQPYPNFVDHGEGARIVDVDGREYVDYVMGYGPLLLGHSLPEEIRERVADQVENGPMYGAPHEVAIDLAECIVDHVSSVEKVRFVNSGTEATTTAVRLARGYTGRDRIVVAGGGYHGAQDATIVTGEHGVPAHPKSPGVTRGAAKDTIQVPFNDPNALDAALDRHAGDVAAVLIEPILGNSGCVLPVDDYLTDVRRIADAHDVLLVFDEVMTGFRIGGLGCAQGAYDVEPDLTTFAKIVGGGFPVGAIGGRRRVMDHLTPSGEVFHASTYAAHPVGMAAGLGMLEHAARDDVYSRLAELGRSLREGIGDVLADRAPEYTVVGRDSMFKVVFTPDGSPPRTAADVAAADGERWERLFRPAMQDDGIMLTANQDESQFLSAAHTATDVDDTVDAYDRALASIR